MQTRGKALTDCKLSLNAIFAKASELNLMVVIFGHNVDELSGKHAMLRTKNSKQNHSHEAHKNFIIILHSM